MAAPKARSAETQLRVGRLTKPHGLKGALKLELFTDDPDRRFVPGASYALQVPEASVWHGKRLELAELRWYNGQPVGFFVGVGDRSAAESLVKAILWVDHDESEESTEEDAWYDHQLVGLDVVRDGAVVGVIDRLEHLPAQDLLVVKAGDREVLVPFVRAIVPEVDVKARRVVVTPPEGLFEVLPDDPDGEQQRTAAPAEAPEQSSTAVPESASESEGSSAAASGAADDEPESSALLGGTPEEHTDVPQDGTPPAAESRD